MRVLLGPHAGHDDHHNDHNPTDPSTSSTLDLRIAAVFIIFAASLAGALPPILLLRRRCRPLSLDSPAARILQAFAGATIAALAVVHVAPVAVELLATLPLVVPYDHLGGAVVLVGLFLTVSADGLLAARTAPAAYKQALRASLGLEVGGEGGGGGAAAAPGDADAKTSAEKAPKAVDEEAAAATAPEPPLPPHHHHHVCARSLAEQRLIAALSINNNDASNDNCGLPLVRERRAAALAYSLEVGCVLHSLLIGLAVGISATAGRSTVAALTTAVALHQAIEGLALGCALGRAPFSKLHAVMMSLVYSLTTPTGVAIGIGVAGTFDPESVAAAAATGVASGLSAGLLLYLGLCQLMMEELSKEDLIVRRGLRWAVHGAVMLGGGLMCVLALWA